MATKFPVRQSVSGIAGKGVGEGSVVGVLVGDGEGAWVGISVAVAVGTGGAVCVGAGEGWTGAEVALGATGGGLAGAGAVVAQPVSKSESTNKIVKYFPTHLMIN